ncbi:MAG: hypothetical protein AB3N14_05235 [Flavobacteriaceae bacterium]
MNRIYRFLIISVLLTISCTDNNEPPEEELANLPPDNFAVKAEEVTDKEATISWEAASDPENDPVDYDVYLGTKMLLENSKLLSLSIEDLEPDTDYSGKVVASDGKNETSTGFSFTTTSFIPLVFTGDVQLNTQQEVEEFGAQGYNKIEGNLFIGKDDNITNDIDDLSSLNDLMEVSGTVNVADTILEYLEGFDNLTSVGSAFRLAHNNQLINLDALANLENVGDLIVGGFALESIKGLSKVTSVNGLAVGGTYKLTSLEGLENLTEVKGFLTIHSNFVLVDLLPLSQVTGTVENLQIAGCLSTNLEGLHNITRVENGISIIGNDELRNLNGLRNITYGGSFDLIIESNSELQNLDGLNQLTSIGRELYIQYNPNLTNLNGLDNVTTIGGQVWIWENLAFESLEALSKVEEIRGPLRIKGNNALTNLNGLENLRILQGDLQINENENLSDLCGLQDFFINDQHAEARFHFIDKNAYNPTREDIIDGNCSL